MHDDGVGEPVYITISRDPHAPGQYSKQAG